MKHLLIIVLVSLLSHVCAFSQILSYSKEDNIETVAYEVEDLRSEEIQDYNDFIDQGLTGEVALAAINAARAQRNLVNAPATIIDCEFHSEITEEDSIPDAIGAVYILVRIINTTPKTIKEITLDFEFSNIYNDVFDIKTGDKYCTLKFQNLCGRTKSDTYKDIMQTVLKCYHILDMNSASFKKLFYNKKASMMALHSVKIVYSDGTTSSKAALFDGGILHYDIYRDGPLSPYFRYIMQGKD